MRPVLGELELPAVQQVTSMDRRDLVTHTVPGLSASVLQNLGRAASVVLITGLASGSQAQQLTEQLDASLRDGTPLTFVADITADSKLDRVVATDLSLTDGAGEPALTAYRIVLREFTEPPPPADQSVVEDGILDDAAGLVGDLTLGLDGASAFVAELSRVTAGLGDLLTRLQRVRDAAG